MAKKLNKKQEQFCQLYAGSEEFFCNGVQAYIEAYNPKRVGNWYNSAKSSAFNLLTKAYILERIEEIFESRGLNDAFVDKRLEKMITQDADFRSKVAAIKEYNKLKQRIVEKSEATNRNLNTDVPAIQRFVETTGHGLTIFNVPS